MCFGCNQGKGNGVVVVKKEIKKKKKNKAGDLSNMVSALEFNDPEREIVGKTLWRRSGKSRTMKPVGEASSVAPNPHTGFISAKFKGNDRTFHRLSSLYVCVTT